MLSDLLTSTAFGGALVFGFRHGFDWDHLAALTDLTGSQRSTRRSMRLATLYVVGHALMVLVLGVVAIVFAEKVPTGVDGFMERLVGVSLISLGVWIIWSAVRTRSAPPLRSRWMVLIGAMRGLLARRRGDRAVTVIEHSHPHDHGHPLHDHPHPHHEAGGAVAEGGDVVVQHTHLHRHVGSLPADPFASYTSGSAFGIGLLHGVGAETPTQVLVFAAAAHATNQPTSIALLGCFVVGLVAANTLVAAASTLGFRRVLTNRAVAIGLAAVTATFSLVIGTLLVTGHAGALPPVPGT